LSTIIHLASCPLCRSESQIREIFTAFDHTASHQHFPIWHCRNCSVRFTQDIPGPESMGPYYQSDQYISHTDTRSGMINRLYHMVRKRTLRTKLGWVVQAYGRKKGKILDMGCGTGAFLQTMKNKGWDVTGLEPDAGARQKALDQYGLSLLESSQFGSLGEKSFGVITLWHVLEHIHGLHATMDDLIRLLHPQGVLIIAVPNYTSLDAAHYGSHWAAYDVPRHLYHFSPASMQYLVDNHGLVLVDSHSMIYDAFYVSMLTEKYLNRPFGVLRGISTGIRSSVNALYNPDRCSSIVYVLKLPST
jgi:SAM-dependent methyltransferase